MWNWRIWILHGEGMNTIRPYHSVWCRLDRWAKWSEITVFVWESDRKRNFFQNQVSQFVNQIVKILDYTVGRRLYSPSLKDVTWLEDAQLIFLILHTFVCKFGWVDKRLDAVRGKKINRVRSSQATSFKLGEYNLLLSILTLRFINCVKFNYAKTLFAIGFPYKHCNFWPLCVLVKMASKTVIRPIENRIWVPSKTIRVVIVKFVTLFVFVFLYTFRWGATSSSSGSLC